MIEINKTNRKKLLGKYYGNNAWLWVEMKYIEGVKRFDEVILNASQDKLSVDLGQYINGIILRIAYRFKSISVAISSDDIEKIYTQNRDTEKVFLLIKTKNQEVVTLMIKTIDKEKVLNFIEKYTSLNVRTDKPVSKQSDKTITEEVKKYLNKEGDGPIALGILFTITGIILFVIFKEEKTLIAIGVGLASLIGGLFQKFKNR